MGYTTATIHLQAGKDNYTVYMENDSKQLNELVVTGYQAIDRRKLTSAVTTIKMSDEIIGGVNNIDQALAGQIAGLSSVTSSGSPGAPVKLRIRGTSSINGTQDRSGCSTAFHWRHRHPVHGRFTRHRQHLSDFHRRY